jgi:hypothetical protein
MLLFLAAGAVPEWATGGTRPADAPTLGHARHRKGHPCWPTRGVCVGVTLFPLCVPGWAGCQLLSLTRLAASPTRQALKKTPYCLLAPAPRPAAPVGVRSWLASFPFVDKRSRLRSRCPHSSPRRGTRGSRVVEVRGGRAAIENLRLRVGWAALFCKFLFTWSLWRAVGMGFWLTAFYQDFPFRSCWVCFDAGLQLGFFRAAAGWLGDGLRLGFSMDLYALSLFSVVSQTYCPIMCKYRVLSVLAGGCGGARSPPGLDSS